jgi:LuxR family transcriptional regulator, maltose regulon positive regulatory protein
MLAGLGALVDSDAVSLLAHRTEGWAAGLQLAVLGSRPRRRGRLPPRIAATDRNIVDYLTGEVLDRQPDDVTDFLLATSVLRELDARVCRAITGDPDPQARLRDIEARGLFLVPLDDRRQRYRYHQLFAELLQGRLRMHDEQREVQLHGTADWYATEGDLDLAVFHAVGRERPTAPVALLRDASFATTSPEHRFSAPD